LATEDLVVGHPMVVDEQAVSRAGGHTERAAGIFVSPIFAKGLASIQTHMTCPE
jgi:hypothetical protein